MLALYILSVISMRIDSRIGTDVLSFVALFEYQIVVL